jgi:hypothetical protein
MRGFASGRADRNAMFLAPRAFASECREVGASYVMVMADLAAPEPREIGLGPICRCAIV